MAASDLDKVEYIQWYRHMKTQGSIALTYAGFGLILLSGWTPDAVVGVVCLALACLSMSLKMYYTNKLKGVTLVVTETPPDLNSKD